jgi:UV DNA damage endonuclease
LDELPAAKSIRRALEHARAEARRLDVRLSLHPDQFVVPGSESESVVASSLVELEHQAEVATHIGTEQITPLGAGGLRKTGRCSAS